MTKKGSPILPLEYEPREAWRLHRQGVPIVDIRPAAERLAGTPEGAIPAPADLQGMLAQAGPPGACTLLLVCGRGIRSLERVRELRQAGVTGVAGVRGGFEAWLAAALPASGTGELSAGDAARYARHLVLPEVGAEGQRKLLDASVLLLGAGGLGSPAAQYLAGAGVGRIGILDHDRVERSNLQRQILHEDAAVGELKTRSAARRLAALNPDIRVEPIDLRLCSDNVEAVLPGWDVVIDGADNFATRYLLNDACVRLAIPLVYGAVMRFEGQTSVFWPARSPGVNPCYRCLFPLPPLPADAPDCSAAGVLGVLPGLIGTLQATEALKLLLDIGTPLVGRLLRVDALRMHFSFSAIRPDPHCPLCAPGARFPGYIDYEAFCRR